MTDRRFDPEVVVSVDTPGLGAQIEHEGDVYTLVAGEIKAGTVTRDGDSGRPRIAVESRVKEFDGPDRYEGESIVVKLGYGKKSVTFPAVGLEGTEAHPAAFESVRGEEPAGKFAEYDTAMKVLKRADNI